jgi:glycine oxidase
MRVRIMGAGIAGLATALECARAGLKVEIFELREAPGLGCSFLAGGMIAPWCEAESADEIIKILGLEALTYWTEDVPVALRHGSLVLAPARDQPELARFSRRTSHFEKIDSAGIAALEPDLAGRFSQALFFPQECHLDPRVALAALAERLRAMENVSFHFGTAVELLPNARDWTLDCRGLAARDDLPKLRGVKGEMLVLKTRDIALSRPIRLIHPRTPVYIVPRGDGRFMVGATMVESEEEGRITARAMLELLGAAYTVHPAFGEAEVIETGAGLRPALPNHLPKIIRNGRVLHINGLYRHGFLLAPALAKRVPRIIVEDAFFPEVMDADRGERQSA